MEIYLATNLLNGKCYVGQTTQNMDHRRKGHLKGAKNGSACAIHNAIRKYGADAFKWTVLQQCENLDELNEAEEHFIQIYNSVSPHGYNLTSGGKNYIFSDETRAKMSESTKKAWDDGRMDGVFDGIYDNPETKKKVSESMKKAHADGRYDNPETRRKMSESAKKAWDDGRFDNPETRKKKSESMKKAHARRKAALIGK